MAEHRTVQLREITFATVREVLALQVSEDQRRYVSTNAISLAEGLLNPGGWPRAVYADDKPVGFAMLLDPSIPGALSRSPINAGCVLLWRFMIDHKYQKRGFAKSALDLLCVQARKVGASALLTSIVLGEHGPEHFYLRYGFVKTGGFRGRNGTQTELRLSL